jgi:lipoate-protein ligase A
VDGADPNLWLRLVSGPGDYAFNMALDEALLEATSSICRPVLRFYAWSQLAASFGYFQKYTEIERLTTLRPLVRRPTGGGLVPHDSDWTYSLVFPTLHEWYSLAAVESYRRLHEWIQAAFAKLNVTTELAAIARRAQPGACFSGYEQFDLLWEGQKIAGAAQRRRRDGLLIQGSVQPPRVSLERAAWQQAMCESAPFAKLCWDNLELGVELKTRAATLALEKYSQAAYNQRR